MKKIRKQSKNQIKHESKISILSEKFEFAADNDDGLDTKFCKTGGNIKYSKYFLFKKSEFYFRVSFIIFTYSSTRHLFT